MSNLTFHFSDPADLLEKLQRDLVHLQAAVSSADKQKIADHLFNFCSTGYAIKDWLKANCNASFRPADVETYVASTPELSACKDICNSYKHYTVTHYVPSTGDVYASATAVTLAAVSLTASGVALDAELTPAFRVKILMKDGIKFEVIEFAKKVVAAWSIFFVSNGV